MSDSVLAEVQDKMNQVHNIINSQEFQDIEIGAACDVSGLEDTLNGIIEASGMTAEQAQSLLASMGLDAELETEQQEQEDPVEYAGLTPTLVPKTFTGKMPVGEGKDVHMEPYSGVVYGVSYQPQKASLSQKKAMSAFGLKVTAQNGASSGGKVSIKTGTLRKASSGGAKYNNASHGGGSQGAGNTGGGSGGGGCFAAGTLITT